MCLATPLKIKQLNNQQAVMELPAGEEKTVDVSLVQQPLQVGEYLICSHNIAINKLSQTEAAEILGLAEKCQHHRG